MLLALDHVSSGFVALETSQDWGFCPSLELLQCPCPTNPVLKEPGAAVRSLEKRRPKGNEREMQLSFLSPPEPGGSRARAFPEVPSAGGFWLDLGQELPGDG